MVAEALDGLGQTRLAQGDAAGRRAVRRARRSSCARAFWARSTRPPPAAEAHLGDALRGRDPAAAETLIVAAREQRRCAARRGQRRAGRKPGDRSGAARSSKAGRTKRPSSTGGRSPPTAKRSPPVTRWCSVRWPSSACSKPARGNCPAAQEPLGNRRPAAAGPATAAGLRWSRLWRLVAGERSTSEGDGPGPRRQGRAERACCSRSRDIVQRSRIASRAFVCLGITPVGRGGGRSPRSEVFKSPIISATLPAHSFHGGQFGLPIPSRRSPPLRRTVPASPSPCWPRSPRRPPPGRQSLAFRDARPEGSIAAEAR